MFNDWEKMALKPSLKFGPDFKLITMANWTKLKSSFGGGPEICFFQYMTEVKKENGEVVKETRHDFNPIKVRTHIIKR